MIVNSSLNDKVNCSLVDGEKQVQMPSESLSGQETPSTLNRAQVLGTRHMGDASEDPVESTLVPTILHATTFSSPWGTKQKGILEVP